MRRAPAPRLPRAATSALALACVLLAASAPAASAGKEQLSFMQDDRVLTYSGPQFQQAGLDQMQALGVDVIRSLVTWRRLSPAPTSTTMPAGFDPSDPASYAPQDWDPFDSLVRGAQARGMQVYMSISGKIPDWASGCKVNTLGVCRPNAQLYEAFAPAVARRYSGLYRDENQGAQVLPAVHMWGIWNEANLGPWIWPQTVRSGHRRIRTAARIYRGLAYAGIRALRANGHAADTILIPDSAPLGGGTRATRAVDFYADLFCVDRRGRRLRGRAAREQGCVKAPRLDANGIAAHPYVRGAGAPLPRGGTTPQPKEIRAGAISVGLIGRLKRLMRFGARAKLIRPKLPIYFTEFGVSTNPPDGRFGVSLSHQAAFLNQVDFAGYRDSTVRGVAQFELEDAPLSSLTFQTGLEFVNGTPKQSLSAYRLPIFVTTSGRKRVRVWGQARSAPDGAPEQIEVQNQPKGQAGYTTVATQAVNRKGFIDVRVPRRTGTWRLRWTPSSGTPAVYSRVAHVDRSMHRPRPGLGVAQPGPAPGPGPSPPPPDLGHGPSPPPGSGPPPSDTPPDPGEPPPPQFWPLTITFQRTDSSETADVNYTPGTGEVKIQPTDVVCNDTCSQSFEDGTLVTLTETPGAGSQFTGWGGACASAGTGTTCTLSLSDVRDAIVNFDNTAPRLPLPTLPFALAGL
ncbi:MAG TPA: hypothetical protein VF545_05880 [Thermoleophilaceae bacterium]